MQLTQNFSLQEMIYSPTANLRGINNTPGEAHLANLTQLCRKVLQPIRFRFQKPIKITSGFRSPKLNQVVGGAKTSQHLKGEAADIISDNNAELWDLICSMILNNEITVGQLIDEKNLRWIHISLPDSLHTNQILHL